MSPRVRVYAIVAACAAAAAGLTVGVTLVTRTAPPKPETARAGAPPLVLELGVRTDREAVALRRAADLYDKGQARRAGLIFGRYHSLEAEVGAALAVWPDGFAEASHACSDASAQLARPAPLRARALLARRRPAAKVAWRAARRAQPDTPYAVRAEDLLHPNFPRGLPSFVPSFPAPPGLGRLSPPKQLALLERRARAGGVRDKLSTASRCSGSAARSRRCASTRRQLRSRPAIPSRRSPSRLRASTRPTRPSPSRGSACSRAAIPRVRACASTSASACSGSAAWTRRSASSGSLARPARGRRSASSRRVSSSGCKESGPGEAKTEYSAHGGRPPRLQWCRLLGGAFDGTPSRG